MKRFRTILFSALAAGMAITASSCVSERENSLPTSFHVLNDLVSFKHQGGEDIIKVVADAKPTATVKSGDEWCTVEYVNQDDTYNFRVTAAAKDLDDLVGDTAVVSISEGYSRKDIKVARDPDTVKVVADIGMNSSAQQIAAKMYAGINIGNTMEAGANEGSCNSQKAPVNRHYIKALKAAGFNAVRIPCNWYNYLEDHEDGVYTIKESWLNHVKDVVTWCISEDLYVVLNAHWDTGWLEDYIFTENEDLQDSINAKQKAIWTQIANKMNDFDEHLLFAAMNEPGMNETSSKEDRWQSEPIGLQRLKIYQQTMLDAVRATGGNNAKRVLIMQVPGASISVAKDNGFDATALPTDQVEGRLMAEAHFYEPYQFCLMEKDADWGKMWYYWGAANHVDGSERNATTDYEERWVDTQMGKLKELFVDKGVPVILGEFGADIRTLGDGEDQGNHEASVAYFAEYVTKTAKTNGIVPFLWETGAVINHKTGDIIKQNIVNSLIKGAAAGHYPY